MNSYVNIKMFSFPFGSEYDCRGFFIHYFYGFNNLLRDAICMKNQEYFVYVYRVKGFHRVDENNGCFFVVSYFFDDMSGMM